MTGLWTGSDGEAGRGASELVGVLPPRHVLPRHGRGLGGGVHCIWMIGAYTRGLSEVRELDWVHWLGLGVHGLTSGKWSGGTRRLPRHAMTSMREREVQRRSKVTRGDGRGAVKMQIDNGGRHATELAVWARAHPLHIRCSAKWPQEKTFRNLAK